MCISRHLLEFFWADDVPRSCVQYDAVRLPHDEHGDEEEQGQHPHQEDAPPHVTPVQVFPKRYRMADDHVPVQAHHSHGEDARRDGYACEKKIKNF
ncbi:hypothetical protein AVEN_115596-1 [Araneus ventricosus]|uniref:Uncharacterized protein n=1 Tax=Araneus ventricosus TaxID=182803 RepID=A0A4Y2FW53_ARAVE|nr:hypothetical protein AVEN_115596-1 [Araneus ventricosus]